jgi:hypothetical protein
MYLWSLLICATWFKHGRYDQDHQHLLRVPCSVMSAMSAIFHTVPWLCVFCCLSGYALETGDPDCPCLLTTRAPTPGLNCTVVTTDPGQCYPLDYGSSCKAWDNNLEPYCGAGLADAPHHCHAQWCFVNETICRNSKNHTLKKSMFYSENIYYSYATCGAKDTWTSYITENQLTGVTLRASLMATWYPYAFGRDENSSILPDCG